MLDRSFGSDPVLVTQMVKAYMKGLEEHHVYGTPKHFPGHGATEGDSHKGFAYTYKTWDELEQAELVPFAGLIQDNTPFIMAGHISLPQITGDDTPSSLSSQVLTDYLRGHSFTENDIPNRQPAGGRRSGSRRSSFCL